MSRIALMVVLGATHGALGGDWVSWRGAGQNGVSAEQNLPSSWSQEGENLVWSHPFGGRSAPVVLNGRVYIINKAGEGLMERERVMCFDAANGKVVWEHQYNVFHTDIPAARVGWSNPCADPETGYVYTHGVGGMFFCFDKDGKVIWSMSMTERFGRISGYGGRTNTPVVDEDLVIISFLTSGWGDQTRGSHRYLALDKRTGDVVWWSQPGGSPEDTTYSTPVVTVVNGVRMLIACAADGWVYGLKIRTGEKVWGFELSKRGLNSSPVVDGYKVYASHSEENTDNTAMGRVVCIDARGEGEVTKTHELWRADGVTAGYASPILHEGKLYVVNNIANLHCFDAETGKDLWEFNYGTVAKGSPVLADGKIYVGEVSSKFHILKPGDQGCEVLDTEEFVSKDGTVIELNGSPAVADGRVYFTTQAGIYCIGKKDAKSTAMAPAPMVEPAVDTSSAPAKLLVVPGDVEMAPGEKKTFSIRAYNAKGQFLKEVDGAWSLKGLQGKVGESGELAIAEGAKQHAGLLEAKVGELTASTRVRVLSGVPYEADFEDLADGKVPTEYLSAAGKFESEMKDDSRTLKKHSKNDMFRRAKVYIGPSDLKNYTIQADMLGTKYKRNMSDMGLIANRYVLAMWGNVQKLRIQSWLAPPRLEKWVNFKWQPDVWYRMKMTVTPQGDKALIRGKIWPRNEAEPEAWSIEVEDPSPNLEGAPGLYGFTNRTEIFFDNVKITENK
jgi:outer membrane protein assembly factor BamB